MKLYLALAAGLAIGLVVALPGGVPSDAGAAAADIHKPKRHAKIRLAASRFGRILVDNDRYALYVFTKDGTKGRSRCYGDCARAWPPFKTKRKPRLSRKLDKGKLGVTRRRGGAKQVTYNGRPLYYYVHDRSPGQILCQAVPEFGGTWYVADRHGEPRT